MRYSRRTLLIALAMVAVAWFAYHEHWRIMRPGTWFKAQPRIIPRPEQKPGIDLPDQWAEAMFRFTIRDTLWLTALVAMGAAWWSSAAQEKAERKLLVQSERELKQSVRVWKGRAGAVAKSMQAIGITVRFFDDEKWIVSLTVA
jgi:hypothetical protein